MQNVVFSIFTRQRDLEPREDTTQPRGWVPPRGDPRPVWLRSVLSALGSLPKCNPGVKGACEGECLASRADSAWSTSGRPASWGQRSEALGSRVGYEPQSSQNTHAKHTAQTLRPQAPQQTPEAAPSHPGRAYAPLHTPPRLPQTESPGGLPALRGPALLLGAVRPWARGSTSVPDGPVKTTTGATAPGPVPGG